MIKLIAFLKRKPGMTMEEFKDQWVNDHCKISSKMPGLLGYRVNIAIDHQENDGDPIYDGTAELWWNSVEEMEAAFASDIGIAAGKDADDNLADLRIHLYTEEFIIIPGPEKNE